MTRMLGSELAALIDAHCARAGVTRAQFARGAGLDVNTVAQVGTRAYPSKRIADAIVDALAGGSSASPGGGIYIGAGALALAQARSLPPQTTVVNPTEADRRDRAPRRRVTEAYRARLRQASAAEAVATAMVETPEDLIATVRRRWPEQWQRVVEQARAAGTLPGAMLSRVIERGLEAGA